MKKIIYSLVIMIAASTLFTSCLEYVEPQGIQQLRVAKADYLDALAQLRLADAELQRANAAYVLAEAAFVDALTEAQLIENRIREYDVQIKAAETEYEVDSLQKEKELLQVEHDERMAEARENLAWAQEALRVTLRDIAAWQHVLSPGERILLNLTANAYLEALEEYNEKLWEVEQAKEQLWRLEYALEQDRDWGADYQAEIDFFTAEIARAQAALAAIPERLDLEAWHAELENMRDSMAAYSYSRQAITKDSVVYMTNVYCEGSEAYERALETWLEEKEVTLKQVGGKWVFKELNDVTPGKPVPPNAADYATNSKKAELKWDIEVTAEEKADVAAKLIYDKYVDLITDYAAEIAPFGDSTTIAGGAYYGKVVTTAGPDTLKIQARVDMKDFILNDTTDVKKEYRWKKGNVETVNEGLYGLKGAYSILERHLVAVESASQVAAKQAAYDAARQAWEDDRAYLIGKTYETEAAAALANLKTSEYIDPPVSPAGRAEDLIWIIKDFIDSRHLDGKGNSAMDTAHLIAAIKNFVNAKRAYIGEPADGFDHIEYVHMGTTYKTYLGDITIQGFRQTHDGGLGYSIYSGKQYQTKDNDPKKAVDSIWAADQTPSEEYHYDAILKIFRVLFPDVATNGGFDTWYDAETWVNGLATLKAGTDELKWMYDDGTPGGADASDPGYDITLDDLGLKSMAATKFLEVYNRFWGLAGTGDEVINPLLATWDAGCYSDSTFNVPYRIARFTGNDLNYNVGIATILSMIDPNRAVVGTSTWNWNAANVNNASAIFRSAAEPTEFRTMLIAEEELILELAKTTYRATLDKIKAKIDQIEADFDAKAQWLVDEYASKLADYNTKKAAWDTKEAERKAKIKALLLELTGAEDGLIVPEIEEPVNYMVPSCMKKYLDHEGNDVFNGEYDLGGKQLEWAEEFLKDYPANLKEWMIRDRTIKHVNMHLTNMITILDPAYQAATGIYTYDWEKYVIAVDPNTHVYEIDIETMQQDLGEGAATLAEYFANYNKYQKNYTEAWQEYLEKCDTELHYWKEVLAAFEAGYDPLEMAVKAQRYTLATLEGELAVLKKRLEQAEAEYNETIAIILN